MKRYAIFAMCVLITSSAFSQYSLQDPVSSKTYNPEKYSGIRGTPFLTDKWMKGTVTTPRGTYHDLDLKFNVYDNVLSFNKNDETFEFQDDITSFTLMPKVDDISTHMVFRKGISGADLRGNEFVEVLVEGAKVNVYKLDVKQLSEMSEINAGLVKTFVNNAKYYIQKNNTLKFIKPNKAEILDALSDKQDKIQQYLDQKKPSFKKDVDVIEIVKYYNSL